MNLEAISRQVIELSIETGEFILTEQRNFDSGKIEYKGHNNLVSYVDKESERRLVAGLRKIVPEAGFIAEEGTGTQADHLNWVIDPLDGTTNFIHGIPMYCTSIALVRGKEPIVGVVNAMNQAECFWAFKNGGAYLNQSPIQVAPTTALGKSLVATGFPYQFFEKLPDYLAVLGLLMQHSHGIRRLGSAAIDLSYVACGRFEAFFEYNLNPWDVAAGALIVQEAGGTVSDFGNHDNYIFGREILAAGAIHPEVLRLVRQHFC